MVLGKLPVPGRPTIWITVGQGPTAVAVGAGGGCLDIFTLICTFSPLCPSLWETARYRLKYCLKGPLNQNQPTNQPYIFVDVQLRLSIVTSRILTNDFKIELENPSRVHCIALYALTLRLKNSDYNYHKIDCAAVGSSDRKKVLDSLQ